MKGLSSKGCFARRLLHGMRDSDRSGRRCRDSSQKRVMVDHEGIQRALQRLSGNENIIHQEQQRAGPMSLWMYWWNAIWRLRPAFSRLKTFLWFATAVAGFAVRTDMLGVTSIVRLH